MTMMVKSAGLAGGGSGSGGGLSVSVSPSNPVGGKARSGAVTVNTEVTTATPAGGTGSYTYAWTKLTGDANWSIESPSAAATRFTRTDVGETESYIATFKCTVTSGGSSVDSTTVEATVTNFGP